MVQPVTSFTRTRDYFQQNMGAIIGGSTGAAAGFLSTGSLDKAVLGGKMGASFGAHAQNVVEETLNEEFIPKKGAVPASLDSNKFPGIQQQNPSSKQEIEAKADKPDPMQNWQDKGGCPCCNT